MWSLWTEAASSINWLALFVAGLSSFVLGSIWYAPQVFGRKWMELTGIKVSKPDPMAMAQTYLAGFITILITAWGVAVLHALLGVDGWIDGLTFGLFSGLVFIASNSLMNFVYEHRSLILWKINNGYSVLGLTVISVVLAVWPK